MIIYKLSNFSHAARLNGNYKRPRAKTGVVDHNSVRSGAKKTITNRFNFPTGQIKNIREDRQAYCRVTVNALKRFPIRSNMMEDLLLSTPPFLETAV